MIKGVRTGGFACWRRGVRHRFGAVLATAAGLMQCALAAGTEFTGSVALAGQNFGGPPYCSYHVDLSNVAVSIELANDRSSALRSLITGTHKEVGLNNCPYPTAAATTFQYVVESQSVSGNAISINYVSVANPNYPQGQAKFVGSVSGSGISGTLTFRRTDLTVPSLQWQISAPLELSALPGPPRGVRLVLFLPADRQANPTVIDNIKRNTIDLQAWTLRQMGGRTFPISSADVEVCRSPRPASYFFDAPFFRVADELAICFGWTLRPWDDASNRYAWVVYTPLRGACNSPARIGASLKNLSIMGQADVEGLAGNSTVTFDCGDTYTFGIDRWTGGEGHELGHAFGLPHPPGCDQGQMSCDSAALMWLGYLTFPSTYLRSDEKATLAASAYFVENGTRTEDRLFNWAESVYPQFFGKRGRVMLEFDGYYYREYPQTRNYLGVKAGRVWLYGEITGYAFRDVGTVQEYLPAVGAAGF